MRSVCQQTRMHVCSLQAVAMQGEQRSLLSALEAMESALHNARQACDEQTQLRQRYEVISKGVPPYIYGLPLCPTFSHCACVCVIDCAGMQMV